MFKEETYLVKSQGFPFDIVACDEQTREYLINNPLFQSFKNVKINLPIKKIFVLNTRLIIENDSLKKIGEVRDEKQKFLLYKNEKKKGFYYVYIIQGGGEIEFKGQEISLYIEDFEYFLSLFGGALLGWTQRWSPNTIVMHGGVFQYKKKTVVVFGNNGSGKTTFLLNLSYSIPGVRFLCDDIVLLIRRDRKIYACPILNGNIEEIEDEVMKSFAKKLKYKQLLSQMNTLYEVDKILFLKLCSSKRETRMKEIKSLEAFKQFLSHAFLAPFLAEDMDKAVKIFSTLLKKNMAYQINLGFDLKSPGESYKKFVKNIFDEG